MVALVLREHGYSESQVLSRLSDEEEIFLLSLLSKVRENVVSDWEWVKKENT